MMKKKYYKVTIQRIVMVNAANQREAKELALLGEQETVGNVNPDSFKFEVVTTLDEVPKSWRTGSPYENEEQFDLSPMSRRLPWATGWGRNWSLSSSRELNLRNL